MIPTSKSVPELLQEKVPDVPANKKPVRLIVCGLPKGVDSIIHQLYVKDVAEVWEWSPPIPSPVRGEIIRILTRYFTE
ncbi:MAG: hypothetical protein MUE44_08545 [Oscillatoriaceae cyanobacterium Prado104]|jgi:hypothetical protein|nr:hypothetical protein [Oscillatoriaceae cyanobacterium Prado104]